ncbi:MAG TPA: ATP-binding protein [Steroidobacter sp.]|uniref:sensor histidine kinase n=1 Tax=Steroidobacter sp. TaxID=1978227 RepID=UPI002ED9D606
MIGIVAANLAGAAVMSGLLWPRSTSAMLREELADEVERIDTGLRVDASGKAGIALSPEQANLYDAMPKDAAYVVLDRHGRIATQSTDGPAVAALLSMQPDARTTTIRSGDVDIRLQVTQEQMTRAGEPYTIRVARSDRLVTTLNDYADELYLRSRFVTILLALSTFTLVVYLTVNRMVRPLRQASEVAARIGPQNLATRLRTDGLPTELVPLIVSFNAALERLEVGFRVQQEFLASAAHELKTPLALLQAEIELGGAANTEYLLRDTALMARIVHQLLHLAEVSEGHNYTFTPISLQAEVREAVEYLKRLADQHSVRVELEMEADDTVIDADRGAVFVLVKNLLENAIHHAPPGSAVRVSVGPHGFKVRDEGPGVTKADEPHLFQRFWRAEGQDSNGAGLGLTICKQICQAHRWQIYYEAAPTGACFVVSTASAERARG